MNFGAFTTAGASVSVSADIVLAYNISLSIYFHLLLPSLEVITRLFSYRPVYQGRASIISPRR